MISVGSAICYLMAVAEAPGANSLLKSSQRPAESCVAADQSLLEFGRMK
jgi:hypothetical protein